MYLLLANLIALTHCWLDYLINRMQQRIQDIAACIVQRPGPGESTVSVLKKAPLATSKVQDSVQDTGTSPHVPVLEPDCTCI